MISGMKCLKQWLVVVFSMTGFEDIEDASLFFAPGSPSAADNVLRVNPFQNKPIQPAVVSTKMQPIQPSVVYIK